MASVYLVCGVFKKRYFDVLLSMCSYHLTSIYILVDFIYTDAISDAVSVVSMVYVLKSSKLEHYSVLRSSKLEQYSVHRSSKLEHYSVLRTTF